MAARRGVSLAWKIFLGTGAVVTAVLGGTLFVTARGAARAADAAVDRALGAARTQLVTQLAGRSQSLQQQLQVAVDNPNLRARIESRGYADPLDQAQVLAQQAGANWVQVTDAEGVRLAKSDEPGAAADTLGGPLIGAALSGVPAMGYGVSGDSVLIQAVAVPVQGAAAATVVASVMAVRHVDSTFAAQVAAAGEVDVVFFVLDADGRPRLTASTLGRPPELSALLASLPAAGPAAGTSEAVMRKELQLGTEHYIGVAEPLRSAGGGAVGGVMVLRSRDAEFAAFNALRRTILLGGGVGLVVAFLLSFLIARGITRPVNALVAATRQAADGDYSADIAVRGGGEIGALADAFRAMLADLREKQQLVEFLGGAGPAATADARTVQLPTGAGPPGAAGAAAITPGQTFAHRYDVKELLGVGGMGAVFKAVDTELDEVVAVKTLRPGILSEDPSALERFKSEIRLARRISHRHVVRTHDLGEFQGTYFITMEYVEGRSLKELIRARGKLPVAVTLSVAKQLARALEVAHDQGVIHRDIKPQNMVVQPDGVLKVMDFGIARLAKRESGVTQAGMVVGTPEYMAPEQLLGDEVDARADLYAAGCVLYECLAGRPPVVADNPMTLIARVLEDAPIPIATLNPEVPPALAALVMRTLSRERDARPRTALELHDLLAEIG